MTYFLIAIPVILLGGAFHFLYEFTRVGDWTRIVLHYLFGVELVVLEDFDGELNLRIVCKDALGRRSVERMGYGIHPVTLADDGTCPGGCYVKKWHSYPAKA